MIDSCMPRKLEPGIRRDVLEAERLDDVDHEVAAGTIGGDDLAAIRRIHFARRDRRGPLSRRV